MQWAFLMEKIGEFIKHPRSSVIVSRFYHIIKHLWLFTGIRVAIAKRYRRKYSKKQRKKVFKTSALIFSRHHWENADRQNVGSGRMQRKAFECLQEIGLHPKFAGQDDKQYPIEVTSADVIVSLAPGLIKLPIRNTSLKLLYTCNTHVSEKIRRLRLSSRKWQLGCEEWPNEVVYKAAYQLADYLLIAENDQGINNFIKHGVPLEKIRRYNNAVDDNVWVPNQRKQNKFTFVCWSTHGLRKGLPVLVDAWQRWYHGQKAELHLLGIPTIIAKKLFQRNKDVIKGEYRPGLQLNLQEVPSWHKPVIDFIGSCHVAVYPTLEDAQPSALLEAASCGLPIVTTIESGVNFTDDFCLYVKADDSEALAGAFEYWYQNQNDIQARGHIAREYILANHTWNHFERRFKEILEEVTENSNL